MPVPADWGDVLVALLLVSRPAEDGSWEFWLGFLEAGSQI